MFEFKNAKSLKWLYTNASVNYHLYLNKNYVYKMNELPYQFKYTNFLINTLEELTNNKHSKKGNLASYMQYLLNYMLNKSYSLKQWKVYETKLKYTLCNKITHLTQNRFATYSDFNAISSTNTLLNHVKYIRNIKLYLNEKDINIFLYIIVDVFDDQFKGHVDVLPDHIIEYIYQDMRVFLYDIKYIYTKVNSYYSNLGNNELENVKYRTLNLLNEVNKSTVFRPLLHPQKVSSLNIIIDIYFLTNNLYEITDVDTVRVIHAIHECIIDTRK